MLLGRLDIVLTIHSIYKLMLSVDIISGPIGSWYQNNTASACIIIRNANMKFDGKQIDNNNFFTKIVFKVTRDKQDCLYSEDGDNISAYNYEM